MSASHQHQQFFGTEHAVSATVLTLVLAGVRLTAFGILAAGNAETGVIQRTVVALDSLDDTIGGD